MTPAMTTLNNNNKQHLLADSALQNFNASDDITSLTSALQLIAAQQRRIRELEDESEIDTLTGMMNARGFNRALVREMDLAQRDGRANALLVLFDLDGLQHINETYGYVVGDTSLTGFANALKRRVRSTDFIARVGGDEFALLLTDGDPTRLQARAVALSEHLNREIVTHGTVQLTLKASHGAVGITPGMTAAALTQMAKNALFRCKEARRIVAKHLAKAHW